MALMVQEVMNMNAQMTGRIRDVPAATPEAISSIPACSSELYIYNKPCLDFVYTPSNDSRVRVRMQDSCAEAISTAANSADQQPGAVDAVAGSQCGNCAVPSPCNACADILPVLLLSFRRQSWQLSESTTCRPYHQKG